MKQPNKTTIQAIEDSYAGNGVEDAFAGLDGIKGLESLAAIPVLINDYSDPAVLAERNASLARIASGDYELVEDSPDPI